jgi:hypothetical protein
MKKALVSMLALGLVLGLMLPMAALASMSGAIWTTDITGTVVNMNLYNDKLDVYLNGGPQGGGGGLPDGYYYVQVTEPDGDLLGSSYANTPVHVTDGNFDMIYQLWAIVWKASNPGEQGYDDTTNTGGVYKVWASQNPDFPQNESKTDNFKVEAGGGPGPEETLEVHKTAVTSYTRTHNWTIEKSVDTENGYEHEGYPKVWLYVDGSGDETATWTVNVTYEGYDDSDFNISGNITIENTGDLTTNITGVEDLLAGTPIDIDWGGITFPYILDVGETLIGYYSEDVASKIEGSNNVTVTTEMAEYTDYAEIVWGDPTTEVNATVTVVDDSDLFGEVPLGTVTAPDNAQFTYTKDFAWADYGAALCGEYTYDNTASINETGQSASATLKVNVQCYIYETAYAKKGTGALCFIGNGFANWGWTNPITPGSYTWDLWAGAGQCDTSKGTLVGTVTVVYSGGYVTVNYNVAFPYALEETHVYAGTTMFPQVKQGKKWVSTVAPGQYYNASPFGGGTVYVIAHAVVGIPDPNFGP